jgi:GNAT superfamily N-acetyltransferase
MSAEVLVRPATLADSERTLEVVCRSITESCVADHRNDPAVLARWLANKTPEHFARWVTGGEASLVVAEFRGVVRGVGHIQRTGQIHLCYVEPGFQGMGLGAAIVRELERLARSWSLVEVTLQSSADARSFYERLGYVAAGSPQCALSGLNCFPYAKSLVAARV